MRKAAPKKPPNESAISRVICDYLAAKGYFFFRNNNTPIFDPTRKVFRAMPKYAMKGVADIQLIKKGGVIVFLEVKTKIGRVSDDQKEFQKKCNQWGAEYHIVRSLDDIISIGL